MSQGPNSLSGAQPALPRPHSLRTGARRAGQGRREPASAASGTLDAPKPPGTLVTAMGDVPILRSATPTAVIFTLNQDTLRLPS